VRARPVEDGGHDDGSDGRRKELQGHQGGGQAQGRRRWFRDWRIFAWLRPNDLIWNYWVNNYLLGNDPPAFDILFWNADTTRLPAAFHADLIGIFENNPYVHAGKMEVLGEPIDMSKVDVEAYIVAGITDHITPWKACYDSARIYGRKSEFVLANAGHLQSQLNPPGNPKAFFFAGKVGGPDPDAWASTTVHNDGSWWPHWMAWMHYARARWWRRRRAGQPQASARGGAG
jgi:polyhydroxyalkanoate synthase